MTEEDFDCIKAVLLLHITNRNRRILKMSENLRRCICKILSIASYNRALQGTRLAIDNRATVIWSRIHISFETYVTFENCERHESSTFVLKSDRYLVIRK